MHQLVTYSLFHITPIKNLATRTNMKKLLLTAIVLVNAVTLYFWAFPYQSKVDINTFRLADSALKRQCGIIGSSAESQINSISKTARAYPQIGGIKDTAKTVYSIYKDVYTDVQILKDSISKKLPKGYLMLMNEDKNAAYSFWNRIRPFHYRIPKEVFQENLTDLCKQIKTKQNTILTYVNDKDLKKELQGSLFVDVEKMPELLKNVNFSEALALLSSIQNRLYIARNKILAQLESEAEMATKYYEFREFVPIVYAKTSHLKLGDTYEAEVFAAAYSQNPNMKTTVDGKEIPMKDGVAIYTVTPTSVGKKKALVKMFITNPFTRETKSYHQEFEYEVVNCN